MDKTKQMTKDDRSALRNGAADAVTGLGPDDGEEAARRLLPLLVPDPKAPVSRVGLRVSREVIGEIVDTLAKKMRNKEKARAVAEGLWKTGADEARVAGLLLLGPLLHTSDDESEARSVGRVKSLVAETESAPVLDALADALSREMEKGATDPWARAFRAWSKDPDRRLRVLGLGSFTHLLSRGKTPEKLFDGLMHARRLAGDADEEVRKAAISLLVAGGRRQPRAVRRFLDRLAEDEREEVKAVADEARAKIPEEEPDAMPTDAMPADAGGAETP